MSLRKGRLCNNTAITPVAPALFWYSLNPAGTAFGDLALAYGCSRLGEPGARRVSTARSEKGEAPWWPRRTGLDR